jgi:hypothetical protein
MGRLGRKKTLRRGGEVTKEQELTWTARKTEEEAAHWREYVKAIKDKIAENLSTSEYEEKHATSFPNWKRSAAERRDANRRNEMDLKRAEKKLAEAEGPAAAAKKALDDYRATVDNAVKGIKKGPPPKKPATECPPCPSCPTSAPAPEAPAPAEAAPAPAPEGKCWTKKVDGDDTWFVRDEESVWDLYERVKNEETGKMEKTGEVIGKECGKGGRRRPTRGGSGERPKFPKPEDIDTGGRRRPTRGGSGERPNFPKPEDIDTGGRRRKTRRSTRGRRR